MLNITFNSAKIEDEIPYQRIASIANSSKWRTKVKTQLWKQQFSDPTDEKAMQKLVRTAKKWASEGVPDTIKISTTDIIRWNRLSKFCTDLDALKK